MAVISNLQENMFIFPNKIEIKNYAEDVNMSCVIKNVKFSLEEWDNPWYSMLKVYLNSKHSIQGRAVFASLSEGFFIKLHLQNNSHSTHSVKMYFSSPYFRWDEVREAWLIGRDRILKVNIDGKSLPSQQHDCSFLDIEINPLSKKNISILYTTRDYADILAKEKENDILLKHALINNVTLHQPHYFPFTMDVIDIKTENILLNSLLTTAKYTLLSAIKVIKDNIKFVEVNSRLRNIIMALILLESGQTEIVEKYIDQEKNQKDYGFLFLLKSFLKITGKKEKVLSIFDYSSTVEAKKSTEWYDTLFEHLYKEDEITLKQAIDVLNTDENILKDPLSLYILLKVYLTTIPKSIHDLIMLKLQNENHPYKEIISALEYNNYNALFSHVLYSKDPFVAGVIFMKYFAEIIRIEMNNIYHKVKMMFKDTLHEKKVLYRRMLNPELSMSILYNKQKKKLEIISENEGKEKYSLEILPPKGEEYEIYVNNQKIPYREKIIINI